MSEDAELLRRYAVEHSEAAITELIRRHVDLLYSAALRLVDGDAYRAQDVTQQVFAEFARQATHLMRHPTPVGWLYTTTRLIALRTIRTERRRSAREQEASTMNELLREPTQEPDWADVRPALEDAMHELGEKDRNAVLLRFFQNKSLKEVGMALGLGENAARMRVERALEKLRAHLGHRGVTSATAGLSTAISANAVQAAPAGLAATISTATLLAGTGVQTTTLIAANKTIAMTALQKTLITAAIIAAVGGGIYEARQASTVSIGVPGRLIDGAQVVLEKVTYGTTHTPPKAPLEDLLRHVPAKWLGKIKWTVSSERTRASTRPIFTFWLRFSSPTAPTQPIGYAIADEKGFEAPMIFDGPYGSYQLSGFAKKVKNCIGLVRGSGTFPQRSRKFFLRLYQQDGNGKRLRVAEFAIKNAGFSNSPGWQPQPLPIERQTNGLVFSLVKAEVGVTPPGTVLAPYDLQAGEWSEFRFRITEQGRPSSGWSINEMMISYPARDWLRVSGEDNGAFNRQFSRRDGEEVACIHRWEFWSEEPAWKLCAHFEHPAKPGGWVEYLVRPTFTRAALIAGGAAKK